MSSLLDPKGLAAMLRIPVSQVYRLTQKGELPHLRVGKYLRFDFNEVVEELHSDISKADI
jgi:excisionase family DNA binding protein